jgi:hypothetical protein
MELSSMSPSHKREQHNELGMELSNKVSASFTFPANLRCIVRERVTIDSTGTTDKNVVMSKALPNLRRYLVL